MFSFRFSNLAYNTPTTTGLPDRELNSVQIVQRGTTVGYDNPGFDSPVDFFKRRSGAGPKLSSMGWSGGPGIGSDDPVICEGSSTPAVSRATARSKDTDSAFQEPSLAVSILLYKLVLLFNIILRHHLSTITVTSLWTKTRTSSSSTCLSASTRTSRGSSTSREKLFRLPSSLVLA